MAIDYPPVFINNYLSDRISSLLPDYFNGSVKFFPTQPTTIDTLTEEFPDASEEVFAVYDRMFRMRRNPFPHKRTEQLLYYFYKTSGGIEALIETTQVVSDLLDNGNESAEDVNYWIAQKFKTSPGTPQSVSVDIRNPSNTKTYPTARFGADNVAKDFFLPYFHDFKIYQLEEARDIIDFGTARTYAGNKIIIEYCWHKSAPIEN
jgi:hypothetical protein